MVSVRAQVRGPVRSRGRLGRSKRAVSRLPAVAGLRAPVDIAVPVQFPIRPHVPRQAGAAHVLEPVRHFPLQHEAGARRPGQRQDFFRVEVSERVLLSEPPLRTNYLKFKPGESSETRRPCGNLTDVRVPGPVACL